MMIATTVVGGRLSQRLNIAIVGPADGFAAAAPGFGSSVRNRTLSDRMCYKMLIQMSEMPFGSVIEMQWP